ncbi:uncharacterized protein N7482_004800 [Penicillium canariense]|uniref:DNA repair protein RAD51 homolog 3 n=1 Tax=Penicillium canariense TaxID=189055 RepID=A0A9W9I796_9EURO|nr:uncharacterized protein N7482_004800 [Penicillium canariense]KAJ5169206.1 hypothetical protein N7482_004800 [Penicillium canariense]
MSINNDLFGLDSQDTLPVVSISASQSLNASAAAGEPIRTGLARLDEALNDSPADQRRPGGILRGQITEIFGPPGVGKTSLALSVASHALRDGGKVVWIDTGSPLASRSQSLIPELDSMLYFRAPTLPHLLALLLRSPKDFPPEETSVIVIDSVSSLFPSYFPSAAELKDRFTQGKITDKLQLQWLLNRKWNVTSDLATHLARLAARNIAVLALNQTHTKIKGQPRATLHPVLAGGAWETSVQTRIVLYRDLPDMRFAEITKRAGKTVPVRLTELIVPFRIESVREHSYMPGRPSDLINLTLRPSQDGLCDVEEPKSPESLEPTPSRKRKAENEIADSQDEDSEEEYAWMGEAVLDPS